MSFKMVSSQFTAHPSADWNSCPSLAPGNKINYNCKTSYPSMVQISAFQTSEHSAFTLYKKHDLSESGADECLPLNGMAGQTSTSVRLSRGGVSCIHEHDEEPDEKQKLPALHPGEYNSQSTPKMKEDEEDEGPPITKKQSHEKRKCLFCGKLYARLSTLKIHMRIHLGLKPYHCLYCSKTFTQSGNRTTHMRVHTGAKPYICTRCGRGFAQSSALKGHMPTHKEGLA